MYISGILNVASRFVVNNVLIPTRSIATTVPLCLNLTNVLCAEPLKKKKRVDPAVVRAREERKRRKIEKQIKRLEKHARQLKPIIECEISTKFREELEMRKREKPLLSVEELERRAQLFKEWNRFKTREHFKTVMYINDCIGRQQKALKQLRAESEELYQSAIQIDPDLLPYHMNGPVYTPPIEGYEAPDGEYIDITKKYEGEEEKTNKIEIKKK